MSLNDYLAHANQVYIKQIREGIELVGFEGRNKYDILNSEGRVLGRAEEQRQGFLGMLFRQVVRHWRSFTFDVNDSQGKKVLHIEHPFRFYFQRLEVSDGSGMRLGTMEKRFAFFSKLFEIEANGSGSPIEMTAGIFKIWTYPFTKNGTQIATVEKKWGGAMREIFSDADTFLLTFKDPRLTLHEKQLLLAAALFIDVQYFEENQGFNISSLLRS